MTGRLARRLRYLWSGMDPDGVELLSAFLSLTFTVLLVYRRPGTTLLAYAYAYAALCLAAGLAKVAGVLLEWRWLRLAGLGLGTIFWVTLAYVLLRTIPNNASWLCFAVLALAQVWAARRVARG